MLLLFIFTFSSTIYASDWVSLGCFRDIGGKRAISGKKTIYKKNTIRRCYERAKQAGNTHFGVQWDNECFTSRNAGSTYSKYKRISGCKNGRGGSLRFNAYRIYNDNDLVSDVKNTLNECSDIVEAVGDFLALFETQAETRRRDQKDDKLGLEVRKKLKACGDVLKIVNAFRLRHFSPLTRGHIALLFDETRFLTDILKGVSRNIGKALYVASKDGDAAAKFHSACDDKGPTVVIVESTSGNVFGGYTDMSWKHKGNYVRSSKSFLFRLRPAKTKYAIKSGQEKYAIYPNSAYGPIFGRMDLRIVSGALSSTSSYTNAGRVYTFPSYPNYQLNDGSKNFKVKDYVVFQAAKL